MNSRTVKFLFYLLITISPLIFFTDLTRNPYYFQIFFAQSGMVLLWILILLKQKGKLLHKTNPFELPMFMFYFFAVITWLVSMFLLKHNYHIPELIENGVKVYGKNYFFMSMFNEGFKKFIFTITNVILVYLFATDYVNKGNFHKIYFTFFFIGFLASIYGILQYFGIELIWPKVLNPFGGRCVSTFGNPNFLSSFLILLFPIMFVNYLYGKKTFVMFVFIITYFSALLSTLTRSSWLGLFFGLVFLCILIFMFNKELILEKKGRLIFLSMFLLALFIFWPQTPVGGNPAPFGRLYEIQQAKEVYSPLHQRFLIWLSGWDMLKEKFFLGKGWGLFELFYPFYQNKYLFIKKLSFRTHANNAHNEIIEVWSQTGTIGLGLYILFFVCLFVYSYKLIKYLKDDYERVIVISLISSVLAMLVDNMLNVTIHFCIPAFLYFFIIGSIPVFDSTRKKKDIILPLGLNFLLIFFGIFIIFRLTFNFLGEINYFKGFKYSKRNDLDKALHFLSKANKFQKYEVNNNYELANTYARLKKNKDAINYYYEALASNFGYDEIHFNLATVFVQQKELDIAKKHYSQALFINPLSKEAYLALGSLMLMISENNLNEAIIFFTRAVELFKEDKDLYNNLGYLYVKNNEEEKALEFYKKALHIDANFELARKNYIFLAEKLKIKQEDNIILQYNKLLKQLEKNVKEGKLDEVEEISEKILEIFPNDVIAKFYLANIYYTHNKNEDAVRLYQEIILSQPDNLNARYNLALALIKLKQYSQAEKQLEYILLKEPNNQIIKQQIQQLKEFNNF